MAEKKVESRPSPAQWPKPSGQRQDADRPSRASHGLIPGRRGQDVNSGGDSVLPPYRSAPPRPEDRKAEA